MAVVVQEMVPSESAGVGFSINPINGKLNEMMVNANFGLGESVVSGDGEIDQWILEKSTHAVIAASIGAKSKQIVSAASGTREVHPGTAEAEKPSLTGDQLAILADLLVRVEQSYAFTQSGPRSQSGRSTNCPGPFRSCDSSLGGSRNSRSHECATWTITSSLWVGSRRNRWRINHPSTSGVTCWGN